MAEMCDVCQLAKSDGRVLDGPALDPRGNIVKEKVWLRMCRPCMENYNHYVCGLERAAHREIDEA